jgi:hypothetical protein
VRAHRLPLGGAALVLCVGLAAAAGATTIDFETIPDGSPSEYLAIGDQFLATAGVRFSLEGGGLPVLAEVGDPLIAFGGGLQNTPDTYVPDQDFGDFFLTDDGVVSYPLKPLIITFDEPVSLARGVILDVDFWGRSTTIYEAFEIEARGAADQVLDTFALSASSPGAGDGLPSIWSFERQSTDIHSIRIVYTGTKDFGVGMAFDNLVFVPEPATALLLAGGCAVLARRRRSSV